MHGAQSKVSSFQLALIVMRNCLEIFLNILVGSLRGTSEAIVAEKTALG